MCIWEHLGAAAHPHAVCSAGHWLLLGPVPQPQASCAGRTLRVQVGRTGRAARSPRASCSACSELVRMLAASSMREPGGSCALPSLRRSDSHFHLPLQPAASCVHCRSVLRLMLFSARQEDSPLVPTVCAFRSAQTVSALTVVLCAEGFQVLPPTAVSCSVPVVLSLWPAFSWLISGFASSRWAF